MLKVAGVRDFRVWYSIIVRNFACDVYILLATVQSMHISCYSCFRDFCHWPVLALLKFVHCLIHVHVFLLSVCNKKVKFFRAVSS